MNSEQTFNIISTIFLLLLIGLAIIVDRGTRKK